MRSLLVVLDINNVGVEDIDRGLHVQIFTAVADLFAPHIWVFAALRLGDTADAIVGAHILTEHALNHAADDERESLTPDLAPTA